MQTNTACRSGSLHLKCKVEDIFNTLKRQEYVKCSTALQNLHKGVIQMICQDMATISSVLIHPNVEVPIHNVNDRGYHKM